MTTISRFRITSLIAACLGSLAIGVIGCADQQEPVESTASDLVNQVVPWTQVGTVSGVSAITSCSDGSLYALHTDHTIWYSTSGTDGSWQLLGTLVDTIDIGCEASLWALNNDGGYYVNGGTPTELNFGWVAGAAGATRIAVSSHFQQYGGPSLLLSDNTIWNVNGGANVQLGTLPDVQKLTGGPAGLYVLTSSGDVFNGYGGDNGWSYVGHMNAGSPLVQIAADYRAPGRLWALLADGRLFSWTPLPARSVSTTNPVAMLDWWMTERTPLTNEGVGPTYVPETLEVVLTGCTSVPGSSPSVPITNYYWLITTPSTILFSGNTASCGMAFTFPTRGTYAVTLTITDAANRQNNVTKYVTPRNFLLVVMGDSIASGEGNPDRDAMFVDTYPFPNNPFPPAWQDTTCHRSKWAGGYQAVRQMEIADPHSSMMFVSAACSGASVANGIVGTYLGLPPQPVQVANTICGRSNCTAPADPNIDAIAMNIGANDVGFSNIVTACGNPLTSCVGADEITSGHNVITGSMTGRYIQADAALSQNLKFTRVYLGEYQDPTKGDDGTSFCDMTLEGAVAYHEGWATPFIGPDGLIDSGESHYLYDQIVAPLNGVIDWATGGGDPHWRPLLNIASQFATHGYCASEPWVVHYNESWIRQLDEFGTLHPNRIGHLVYKNAIMSGFSKVVGIPRISGVWQSSTAAQKLGWNIGSAVFASHINGLSAQGWRLQSVTGYVNNQNQAFYNTVWGRGTATQLVEFGKPFVDQPSFVANVTNHASEGWRLKNFGVMRQLGTPSTGAAAGPLLYNAVYEKGTTTQWTVGQSPTGAIVMPKGATTMKAIDCTLDEGRSCIAVYDNSRVITKTFTNLTASQLDTKVQAMASNGWAVKGLDSYYRSADTWNGAASAQLMYAAIFALDLQAQQRGAYGQPAETFQEQQDVMAPTSNLMAVDLAVF